MLAVTAKLSWYVSRSAGLIAWALVAASIVWGLTLSSRLIRRRGVPAWLLALHRYLGTLSLVFVVIHLLGLVADNYVHFGWSELFIPMASRWRPGPTAWGIAGLYLLIAIQITSWLMRRLPRRLWHTIHLSSIPLFAVGTVHGFQSGADRSNRLVIWSGLVVICVTASLLVVRIARRRPSAGLPIRRSRRTHSTSSADDAALSLLAVEPQVADNAVR